VPRASSIPDKLSFGRKAGFTVGDYACNLYWQSLSIFLLFYYTDVVGLSAAVAGSIYMVASIFDGAIDPFMGALADRTRTRWGRYRPYVLLGAVPLGLAFCLLYYKPPLVGAALAIAILAVHLVFRIAYTTLSIPYTALNARITSSTSERSTIAGFRMVFATLAGLTVAFATQPLVSAFGAGDAAKGFFWTAACFALAATAIFPLVFAFTREPAAQAESSLALRPLDYWRSVGRNRAFWMVMAGVTLGVMSSTTLGKSLLYYFKYVLHDEAGARYALSLNAALGLAAIPAWVFYTRFVGKRAAWLTAAAWGLVGLAGFATLGAATPLQATIFFMFMQVSSLGVSFTFWSMLPDTVEYGQWMTSLRAEAFIFGLGQFFLKAALGLGAGLFGMALGGVGYHPNVPQTAATLAGMKAIIVIIPGVGLTGSALVMLAYPMGLGAHEKIVDDLMARGAAGLEPAELSVE
jgi:GPH family glycoside/pentoside/hexuronide:cation symporter